ncbi:class I SAM-dependent methyltransferase [Staphylococcus auricularis]|uniref:class I SAM-dependent methyltransferase n=1 Tax=Staphylococcus auricularis TaxID=29379 RepID=UPI001EF1D921|nr:class I SAM-dependent methyltransferase [Staphylococcus auricularis]MCG7340789.1 class I SAM-dependent methyltransferase [Staphylococcus auricularis]
MKTLNGIPESMLIPLAARAVETDHSEPIINDPYSKTIFEQLDYPFTTITQAPSSQIGISIRTFILDRVVKYFLEHTKHPLIINIGSGLDTRYKRLKLDDVPWFDIDVPEAIEVRAPFFPETRYHKMIAKSMLDFDWIGQVKQDPIYHESQDILFIFEGILMYFDKATNAMLLEQISEAFKDHNLLFAIEHCSKTIAKHTKEHKSVSQLKSHPPFKYGYNTLRQLNAVKPSQLEVACEFNYFDYFSHRWGAFGLFRFIPFLKHRFNNKIVLMMNKPR